MQSRDDSTGIEMNKIVDENAHYYNYRYHENVYNCAMYCYDDLIELHQCRDPNFQNPDGATPLLLICDASRSNIHGIPPNIDKNFALCEFGANPNITDKYGNVPLQYAVQSKNYALVKLLIEFGANQLKLSYETGWLLRMATKNRDMVMMRKFVKWGCNIFDVNEDGYTALLIATKMNFYLGVRWFLKKAGERAIELINMRANNGTTCIMEASAAGYAKILELLIKHGADCNMTGSHLWFPGAEIHPIAAAAVNNYPKCVELLLPHVNREVLSETAIDPILAATLGDSYDSIILFLKSGYPVDVPNYRFQDIGMLTPYTMPLFKRQYCTALHDAEWRENVAIVRLLIQAGAKMTYTSKCFSPFVFAVWKHSSLEILLQFLQNDVDINAMSDERKCDVPDALLVSLSMNKRDQLMLLLISGLDPMLKNWCKCKNGYSLLHDVINSPDVGDIQTLLKLLLHFSPTLPTCCNEMANVIGFDVPKIPTLLHSCRLAIRKSLTTSQLLYGRFAENFPIPLKLKDYLGFYRRDMLLQLLKFNEHCEETCIRKLLI
ncbi:hypothetical protein DINM_003985 [Dirofilaria immitis]|nr:hypothetical protein [Dirofilaria immitis]